MLSVIFHFSSVVFYLYLIKITLGLEVPPDLNIGMPSIKENWWQYFTCWNLAFQSVYFGLCVAIHILDLTSRKFLAKEKETLRFMRDLVFQSLVLPCTLIVVAVFWSIFTYDREMIFPAAIDVIIPSWLNHCIHTTVLFFAIGEILICRRPFCNIWSRFLFGLVIMVFYNATVVLSYYWQGMWTYPKFAMMTEFQRIIYYCCMYLIYITTYTLGCIGNSLICDKLPMREERHLKTT